MNVLLCHNCYQQPGGEDQVFADEGWLLESRGHKVVRFTLHNDAIEGMSRAALAARTLWSRDAYRQVREIVVRERIEVAHFTNTFPLISPSAYYAAKAGGAAVVQSLHNYRLLCANAQLLRDGRVCEDCVGKRLAWPGVKHGCYRDSRVASAAVAGMVAAHRLLGTWSKAVDRYIALSEFSRQKLIAGGLPEAKIALKPNFVHPAPEPADGRGGYAAFVGRLSVEKGIDVLLAAWSKLALPVPLHIVGDGPLTDQVRSAAKRDPRIRWLGRQPMNEVLRIVGDASILVAPSIWYEVCPKTLIESLAVGTPILASRLGAMAEMVEPGRGGWHFAAGDAADLASTVEWLFSNPECMVNMRRTSRAEFEDKFTADSNYEQLMRIYAAAIAPEKESQFVVPPSGGAVGGAAA